MIDSPLKLAIAAALLCLPLTTNARAQDTPEPEVVYSSALASASASVDQRLLQMSTLRDEQLAQARAAYEEAVARAMHRFSASVEGPVQHWTEAQRSANRVALAAFDERIRQATEVGDLVAVEELRDRREVFVQRSLAEHEAFMQRVALAKRPPGSATPDSAEPKAAVIAAPDPPEAPPVKRKDIVVMVHDDDNSRRPSLAINGVPVDQGIDNLNNYITRFSISIAPDDVVAVTATDRKGGAMAFLAMDKDLKKVLNYSHQGTPVTANPAAMTAEKPADLDGWERTAVVKRLNARSLLPNAEALHKQVGDEFQGIWVTSSGTGRCTAIAWPPAP